MGIAKAMNIKIAFQTERSEKLINRDFDWEGMATFTRLYDIVNAIEEADGEMKHILIVWREE